MSIRKFVLMVCLGLLISEPAFSPAATVSQTVNIGGNSAGAETVLVRFKAETKLHLIPQKLQAKGLTVHSFHTLDGIAHAPAQLIANSGSVAADVAFTLVKSNGDVAGAIAKLKGMPEVEDAAPNFLRYPSYSPNDPYYTQYQDSFRQIDVEDAWNLSHGEGAVVAVIDTGYKSGLDDGAAHVIKGHDFRMNDNNPEDHMGHGTHVSNTIAEKTNNGTGAAGIAFGASIMPLKVFSDDPNDAGAYDSDIIDAINYAAANGADVINMSLGGGGYSSVGQTAITNAWKAGVTVVAAAGNSSKSPVEYPAGYDHVIGVGSSRPHGRSVNPELSTYSDYGTGLDVVAPGEKVVQETFDPTTGKTGYFAYSGTSMASPHVSGVAALMVAVGGAHPDAVAQALFDTAVKSGSGWDSHLGYGEIDAFEAVRTYMAREGGPGSGDDTSAPPTDDAAADDTASLDCVGMMDMVYNQCGLSLVNGNSKMTASAAVDMCQSGGEPWDCISGCTTSSSDCKAFSQCIQSTCSMGVESMSNSNGGGGKSSGGSSICGG